MSTSSTPATVVVSAAPPVQPIPTNPVSTFLKHHETFLIVVLGFALLWFLSGKIQNIIAAHDNANLHTVQVTLTAQVDANKKTAALAAQQAADMKVLNDKVLAQDAALAQANKALATALSQRQQTNNNLPLPELAARWQVLVPAVSSGVSFDGTRLLVDNTAAHATVNELEKVPVLTAQLDNEKKVVENTGTLVASCTKQVVTLNELVVGKDAELKKSDNVCEAKIKVVKDAAKKSKRRWAVTFYVLGFMSRQAIKTYIGL